MTENEKSHDPFNDPPPSYTSYTTSPPPGQTLLDQLTLSRTQNIHSTISTHILPLITQQASYGIARTTLALLPSDIPLPAVAPKSEFSFDSSASGNVKPVEIIGFACGEDEEVKVVRLEGRMNRTEFWRPQVVVEELERGLRERLNERAQVGGGPVRVVRAGNGDGREKFGAREEENSKRGFLSRMGMSRGPGGQRNSSGDGDGSWKQLQGTGLVLVKARLEEVSLRTVNDFGLYDTLARQCVIVRVDARC